MVNDPLGDMLARIRNAHTRSKSVVRSPASKLRGWVLDVLKDEGFIRGYETVEGKSGLPEFEISLKRVSTPGRRVYSGVGTLPQVRNGLGCSIISTPKGVMSDAKARAENVGGEVLCQVF